MYSYEAEAALLAVCVVVQVWHRRASGCRRLYVTVSEAVIVLLLTASIRP